jgi:hypothetical protein
VGACGVGRAYMIYIGQDRRPGFLLLLYFSSLFSLL